MKLVHLIIFVITLLNVQFTHAQSSNLPNGGSKIENAHNQSKLADLRTTKSYYSEKPYRERKLKRIFRKMGRPFRKLFGRSRVHYYGTPNF